MQPISIRPYSDKDFRPAADLVRVLWYPHLEDPLASACARAELMHHLEPSTVRLVAECGGEFAGIALAGPSSHSEIARPMELGEGLQDDFDSEMRIVATEQVVSDRFQISEDARADWEATLLYGFLESA